MAEPTRSAERIVEPALGVSTANWLAPPYNRWGFRNVERLAATAPIPRGDGPVAELPHAPRALDGVRVRLAAAELDLDTVLERTFTDAFVVLHDGAIACERYLGGMEPTDLHLLMSVSKSLASLLCGALAAQGLLRPQDAAADHVPELRGTAWEACTVQHLLDMRTGVRWDPELDEYAILDISGYRTHARDGIPAGTEAWIRALPREREPGGPFAYCSLATDVLAWVLERAGGAPFPTLFGREVWSAIGAERDARLIVDGEGFPVAEGGFCTTARDLARLGQACLDGGVAAGGRRVVPEQWLGRLRAAGGELVEAYRRSVWADPSAPDAFYRDCWWVRDAERGIYRAAGMNGQVLLIHHPSRTVVVKLSTWPGAGDRALAALQDAAMLAVCDALAES